MDLATSIRIWTVWLWHISHTNMVSPLDCVKWDVWDWLKSSQYQDITENPHREGWVWIWRRSNLLTGSHFLHCMGSCTFMESAESFHIFFLLVDVGYITCRWHGRAFNNFLQHWPLRSQAIKAKLICVCIQEWPQVPVQLSEEGLVSHTYNRHITRDVVLSFTAVNCLMILSPTFQVTSISTYL